MGPGVALAAPGPFPIKTQGAAETTTVARQRVQMS
jgi:hypothetical protein